MSNDKSYIAVTVICCAIFFFLGLYTAHSTYTTSSYCNEDYEYGMDIQQSTQGKIVFSIYDHSTGRSLGMCDSSCITDLILEDNL